MQNTEALTLALALAIIAPSDEGSKRATEVAADIAAGCSLAEIEQAKVRALELAKDAY